MYDAQKIKRIHSNEGKNQVSNVSPSVYKSADIAKILGISNATARKLIHSEKLPTVPYTKNILVPIDVFKSWYSEYFGAPIVSDDI